MIHPNTFAVIFTTALFATYSSCISLLPIDHDTMYKYSAVVTFGIRESSDLMSEMHLEADFLMRADKKRVFATLNNVKHEIYKINNETDRSKVELDLVDGQQSLSKPFIIVYENQANIAGVHVQKNDEIWSINIKKAAASLLQLNLNDILTKQVGESFSAEEISHRGSCNILYSLESNNETHVVVLKTTDSATCSQLENIPSRLYISPRIVKYTLRKNDKYSLEEIEATSDINIEPFGTDNHKHTLKVHQRFSYAWHREISKIRTDNHLEGMEFQNISITVEPISVEINADVEKIDVKILLDNIVNFMNSDLITANYTNNKNTQNLIELIQTLKQLNKQNLQTSFDNLFPSNETQGTLILLLETLPHVGTQASVDFILDLLENQSVEQKILTRMIQEFPFYVEIPSVEIIQRLMQLNETGWTEELKCATIISHGNLISKIMEKNPNVNVDEYINHILEKFQTTKSYFTKLGCMCSLYGIKSTIVLSFVEKIIKRDSMGRIPPHIRALSLWIAKNQYTQDLSFTADIYFSILKDENETMEIRIIALNILMSRKSEENFIDIHNYMKAVHNEGLYSAYYSLLKNVASTRASPLTTIANELLAISKPFKPKSTRNFDKIFSYVNGSFGELYRVSYIGDMGGDNSHVFYLEQRKQVIFGEKHAYSVKVLLRPDDYFWQFSRTRLHHQYNHPRESYGVQIIHTKNDKILSLDIYSTYGEAIAHSKVFESFLKNISSLSFDQMENRKMDIISDVGFPVEIYVKTASVTKKKFNCKYESIYYELLFDYVLTENHVYGMKMYNPLTGYWCGTKRNVVVNKHMGLDLRIVSFIMTNLNLSYNRTKLGSQPTFGLNVYGENSIYLEKPGGNVMSWPMNNADSVSGSHNSLFGTRWNIRTLWENSQSFNEILREEIVNSKATGIENQILSIKNIWDTVTNAIVPGTFGFKLAIDSAEYAQLMVGLLVDGSNLFACKYCMRTLALMSGNNETTDWQVGFIVQNDDFLLKDVKFYFALAINDTNYYHIVIHGERNHSKSTNSLNGSYYIKEGNRNGIIERMEFEDPAKDLNATIRISEKLQMSKEQTELEVDYYKKCVDSSKTYWQCIYDHTTLRQASYEFNIVEASKLESLLLTTQLILTQYIHYTTNKNHPTPKHSMKISLEYPLLSENIKIHWDSQLGSMSFNFTPIISWLWPPYNVLIPDISIISTFLFPISMCEVTSNKVNTKNNIEIANNLAADEWLPILKECGYDNCKWTISARITTVEKKLMVLIMTHQNKTVEIRPTMTEQEILVDGETIRYSTSDLAFIRTKHNRIFLRWEKIDAILEHYGDVLRVYYEDGRKYQGVCEETSNDSKRLN